jgi:short-subunit dehydrogenase/acyl carrier protein
LAAARHVGKLVLTPERDPASIRADGAYIVTGGAVGVGFATAEWLAHAGAGRVLLVGRRPPAPAIAERIAQWRRDGVAMTAIAADVGDPAAVARVVAEAGPALRGVFHCASVLDDAPVSELTWNRLAAVLHSKVAGGWNLHRATENHELDLFVLFSSWASIAGSRGGAGYAAANVALDSLAHLRRQQGLPALSINWGPWGETGWATRQPAGRAIPGFFSMTSAMALAAMALALQFGQPQIAIASIDWSLLATAAGRRLGSAFAELAHGRTPAADDRAWSADLLGAFRAAEPDDRHGVAIVELQKLAAAALGVDVPGLIDPDRPLQDFGLDSILAIDLRHTLARALRADLPATLLFDYPTLVELAKFCVGLLPQEAMAPVRLASPPAEDDDLLALIEGLSDDEVDARLSDRRSEAEAVE